jgi:hypothetical protein
MTALLSSQTLLYFQLNWLGEGERMASRRLTGSAADNTAAHFSQKTREMGHPHLLQDEEISYGPPATGVKTGTSEPAC